MKTETLHIALAADSNYMVPITVVLQSIFENNKGEHLCIYLLHLQNSLRADDLQFLQTFVEQRGGVFVGLEVTEQQIAGFPETRHGKAALLRLCLPQLLPTLSKILYLDGDIVVHGNLSALYGIDITGYYIAAGKDPAGIYHPDYPRQLGIDEGHCYFNSGVSLLNLDALRSLNLAQLMSDFMQRYYHHINAPDQDFLNYICQRKTYYIPPRYNMNYAVEKDVLARLWSKDEITEARRSPVIVHYIGPVKPWSAVCAHPRRKLWWSYLSRTPFADFRPHNRNLRNRLHRCILCCTKPIEACLSLSAKQKIGRFIPTGIKKRVKQLLQKRA